LVGSAIRGQKKIIAQSSHAGAKIGQHFRGRGAIPGSFIILGAREVALVVYVGVPRNKWLGMLLERESERESGKFEAYWPLVKFYPMTLLPTTSVPLARVGTR
jgi:hypothetical protein